MFPKIKIIVDFILSRKYRSIKRKCREISKDKKNENHIPI